MKLVTIEELKKGDWFTHNNSGYFEVISKDKAKCICVLSNYNFTKVSRIYTINRNNIILLEEHDKENIMMEFL